MMSRERGFTLIELLVVMSIIMILASMLLLTIGSAQKAFKRAKCETETQNIMTAVVQYQTDFGTVPPSGIDADNNGRISNPADGTISHAEAWPADWKSNEHPLVACLVRNQELDEGRRTYEALYPKGKTKSVTDSAGEYVYLVDVYGNPYRYLADGRRPDRQPSRVSKREPILWSVGLDGLPDPQNNQVDEAPRDGRVDDRKEMHDDLCSWFH